MKIITTAFLIFATTCLAHARLMTAWSYQDLYDKADLVIIAKPISTQDTSEKTILRENISPGVPVVGVSTEFEISVVMKGDKNLKKATLHHYRFAYPEDKWKIGNGPNFVSFDPKQQQYTRFLLFLHLESDGRYSPVSGQTDPALFAVLKLDGIAQ